MTLRPCLSCARHVFVSERCCPFCAAELPERAEVKRAGARLGRLALAAAATLALAGCGGSTLPGPNDSGEVADLGPSPDLSHHTCYGAPPARV